VEVLRQVHRPRDDAVEQLTNFFIADKLLAGFGAEAVFVRPAPQLGEVGRDDDRGKLAAVADHDGFADIVVGLQLALDGLRGDELAAGSLDQVFLAVGRLIFAAFRLTILASSGQRSAIAR